MADSSAARSVETLIKALQKALAPLPTRSALKQDVLYLMVDLPRQGMFSRSMVLHRVASQLGGLPVQGVSQLVVYGRLQGETQPQWKKVFYLSSGESSADATQIVLPGTKISEIKVLEAQKPVVDPDHNSDFRKVKTLGAPVPKIQKERWPEAAPSQASVGHAPSQDGIPTPLPTTARPSSPIDVLANFPTLDQWLHRPALRPFLGGALALSLLLGAGLVVRSFGQADVPARARSLGLGIPLLILAAGGGWLGWKGRRVDDTLEREEGSQDPFTEGLSFLQANPIPEAVERFQEAVRRQPDHVEAHIELAHLLAKTNRLQEALSHYQQAKRLNPNWSGINTHLVETLKALARQWLAQHQPDEVLIHLPEALPLTQGSAQAEIFSLLGQAWAEKGNWAQALAQQQKALELDPHFSEAHLCIAQVRLKLGQWDEAIDSCWAALELNDRLGLAHAVMGQALMRKGQLKAAIAAFRTALNLDLAPELAAGVRVDLGLAMVHAGHLAQASQEFSQVVFNGQFKRQQARAYYGLGLVLAGQEQYSEAVKNYRRALELAPDLHEAMAAIGLAYLGPKQRDASGRKFIQPQQLQQAIQQFEQALKGDPDLPEAHFGMGEASRIKGDLTSAEISYRRAIRSNGSYGAAHYRLGSVFARQGKLDQAIEHFRSALEIAPNFSEARGRLQRLLSKQTEEAHTDLLPL
ncbi:tetratricopeptide repeat protein [Synechococcus sp. W55.1]|uniref:tetratricopeptide repeat protein n=1 Tax=Synechococcus sp. W55.1 TaxID=2964512 RepID=UPI0039C0C3D3